MGERLDESVQTVVDQTKTGINPAVETENHTQFARQMPEPRHSVSKWLDRQDAQWQLGREGVLLGECRLEHVAFNRFHILLP